MIKTPTAQSISEIFNFSSDESVNFQQKRPVYGIDHVNRLVQNHLNSSASSTLNTGGLMGENQIIITTTGEQIGEHSRILEFPSPVQRRPMITIHAQQEWEGYVVEIREFNFVANLIDLTAKAAVEEAEAIIPLEVLSDEDQAKLEVGSIFRWVIGYECFPSDTKRRVSHIVLRDLPPISESELKESAAWALESSRLLNP